MFPAQKLLGEEEHARVLGEINKDLPEEEKVAWMARIEDVHSP